MDQTNSLAYQRAWIILANMVEGADPAKARDKLHREGLRCVGTKGRRFWVREDLTGRTFTITV